RCGKSGDTAASAAGKNLGHYGVLSGSPDVLLQLGQRKRHAGFVVAEPRHGRCQAVDAVRSRYLRAIRYGSGRRPVQGADLQRGRGVGSSGWWADPRADNVSVRDADLVA